MSTDMASKAPKISHEIWDRHKPTILNLFLTEDLSTNELVHTMNEDHGFSATVSQYEAQLRAWDARKRLKRHEWEVILQKLDHLSSQHIPARVVISGHPVSMDRVHRARRHCKSGSHPNKRRRNEPDQRPATHNFEASAVVEVQKPDGTWTLYNGFSEGSSGGSTSNQQIDTDETPELPVQEDRIEIDNDEVSIYPGVPEPSSFPQISPRFPLLPISDLARYNLFASSEDDGPSQPMDVPSQTLQFQEPEEGVTSQTLELVNYSPLLSDLAHMSWGTLSLEGLPFEQFQRELTSNGLKLIPQPSLIQDLRLLPGSAKLIATFLNDAVVIMMDANGKSAHENFYNAKLTLKTLDKILPTPQQRHENNSLTCPSQEVLEIEFFRTLLYSVANGFIGMDHNNPLSRAVATFLYKKSNISTLLPRLFRNNPSRVLKGLGENLFRASIIAGDHWAIVFFLTEGLIDIDTTVCFVRGTKCTPLERVAECQRLEAVQQLLHLRPDVNRTFCKNVEPFDQLHPYTIPMDSRGALGHLIEGKCRGLEEKERIHSAFSPEYMDTVDSLIHAGAKVRATFVQRALTKFVQMDLAKKLLDGFPPTEHSKAISSHMLYLIAENLTDEEAEKYITKIISSCESTGCNQCVTRYLEKVNWAIIVGAKRGHIHLVQTLFQYVQCTSQLLAAAIRGGNNELVRFVLAKKPDMNASIIDSPSWILYISAHRWTVPLAEAIDTRDKTLVVELETKGALANLDGEHQFESIASAAASVGDMEYLKKLLLIYPQFSGYDLGYAFQAALDNKQEHIVRFLFDAGTYLRYFHPNIYGWGSAILPSDIISAFPKSEFYLDDQFKDNLDSSNLGAFNLFSQLGILDRDILTKCLEPAIKKDDHVLVCRLLELGADASEGVNHITGTESLDIIRSLLECAPSTKTYIPQFGTKALVEIIKNHPNNSDALRIFLARKAVDIHNTYSEVSPLGAAITKDAESCHLDFPLTTKLLNAGCDINGIVSHKTYEYNRRANMTPMLVAIAVKDKRLVQFLIERGAHVSKAAINGIMRTPIQAAAEMGCLDIVEFLFQNGADVNEKSAPFHGGTALQFAAIGGYCNIAAFLLDHGANLLAPPSTFCGFWPIEGAAKCGRLDMIQFLWNVSLGGFPIEQCRKAMELAESNGHGACVDLIRELAVEYKIMTTIEGSV